MTNGQEIESVLAIDQGNITTQAVLVDLVEGVYRFLARGEGIGAIGTSEHPLSGLQRALDVLSHVTGRNILSDEGELIIPEQSSGDGVDAFVASTSQLAPLRVVIAGLINSLSVESARRAVESAYAIVEDTIALDEGVQRWGASRGIEAKLERLGQRPPDVVVLVGGVDGGALGPVLDVTRVLVALAAVLEAQKRPIVIFAGNAEARTEVAELLTDHYDFLAVDNVRPKLDTECLTGVQQELERLYGELGMKKAEAFGSLSDWSAVPVVSSAKAFEYVIRFIAKQYGLSRGVLGVDLGGSNTHVFATLGEQNYGVVKSGLGASRGVDGMQDVIKANDVIRWLPFQCELSDLRNKLATRQLLPSSIAITREDRLIDQAWGREAIRLAMADLATYWGEGRSWQGKLMPELDLIVGTGGLLAQGASPGQAALMLLDALQPIGLCRLVLDHLLILPAMGAIAPLHPLAAAQVLDHDGFLELGTVVAPVGATRLGDVALRLKVAYADGSAIEVEVPYGSLEVIPLPPGQSAVIELHPTRRFDIGAGRRGASAKVEVKGGAVGIIIDARGRPIQTPSQDVSQSDQAERVQEWLWSVGG